jgi:hypothetical protein
LEYPYSDIAGNGTRPKIPKDDLHKQFAFILKEKDYISSFAEEKDSIRINTKRIQEPS